MSAASRSFEPTVQWDESVLPYFTAAFGQEGLARLSRVLCRPPLRNSFRVNINRASREVLCEEDHLV